MFVLPQLTTHNPQLMLYIEQIRPEHTRWLRRDVLYPGLELADMAMEEDADGMHFGAFKDNVLAGIVSLFHKGEDFQFRKLAVDQRFQHMGIGTALLNTITSQALQDGGTRLWGNARATAIAFYTKNGFAQTGKKFEKNGICYEIMDKQLKNSEKVI